MIPKKPTIPSRRNKSRTSKSVNMPSTGRLDPMDLLDGEIKVKKSPMYAIAGRDGGWKNGATVQSISGWKPGDVKDKEKFIIFDLDKYNPS